MTIPDALQTALRHHQAGRLADAEALYRQILVAQPNHADALHFLGVIAHQAGRHEVAVDLIRKSIAFHPGNPVAYSNLGETCRTLGRLDEALAAFYHALDLKPDYADAHYNLGLTLQERGRPGDAIAAYRRALDLQPDLPDACNNLGVALRDQGRFNEAIASFHRALELQPDCADAHFNLGNALRETGQLDESIAAYRRALELKPAYPQAQNNLGNALKDQGLLDEAIAAYRAAIRAGFQGSEAHSNLVYTLHFHPGYGAEAIAEERQRWVRQYADPVKQFIPPHATSPATARPLRIGYVSPDFRDHVVGRNLLPLFQRHDRRNFEILGYAGVTRPDLMTDEFRRHSSQWRNTIGVGDDTLADWIRQDAVDILVDLSQHMSGNRLPVFARQPAPVQVSFAGYPESAGLEQIEYRITDQHLEPHSTDASAGRKAQICFIDSFWCYDPCGVEVEINELPATKSGFVTFGNLGNFCKVNEPLLRLWARVLRSVKQSHLVMWSLPGSHRQRSLDTLEREGVEAHRVEFVGRHPRREYLELYHRLDIVLDTFPYNGHTTNLDALWMGVPVVSLVGETSVSRAGLSQLTNLGLPELAAHSEEDYVRIAAELASDFLRLTQLRATLRSRMENSVLMDAPRFARNIESAYRSMWDHGRADQDKE